ncbi:Ivy family c-type lysozyme inhibitor [Pantoea sp. AS142]|uniref:Ivy family c-type lysozyme inhibitor n=1 Tax=Pantoea sp. AS142 TaxID=3081292 RepID=UPI0030181BC2
MIGMFWARLRPRPFFICVSETSLAAALCQTNNDKADIVLFCAGSAQAEGRKRDEKRFLSGCISWRADVSASAQPYIFDFIQKVGRVAISIAYGRVPFARMGLAGQDPYTGKITIKGATCQVLSGCKPHNCPALSIAILYSPEKGAIHGVYSDYDQKIERQTLTWLNLNPAKDAEMRNILFTI